MFGLSALLFGSALATETGGHIETHYRVGLNACDPMPSGCALLDFRDTAVVGTWLDTHFEGVSARFAADLRLHLPADIAVLEDTQEIENLQPVSLRMKDAWVDLPISQGNNPTRLRLGLQTISWGVADGLHVNDPINPLNLENPLALDSKLSVPAVHVQLGGGVWSVEAVAVPFYTGSLLTPSGFSIAPNSDELLEVDAFEGNEVGQIEARLNTPRTSLQNASAGLRAEFRSSQADFALTAYTGRDSIPQANGALMITGFQTDADRVDFAVPLIYPHIQTLGVDTRAELFWDMSAWVEWAAIFPQQTQLTVSEVQMQALAQLGSIEEVPNPLPSYSTQDGEMYSRWIAGIDRSFGPLHLSVQWMHGFPLERQKEDLRDYGIVFARFPVTDTLLLEAQAISDLQASLSQTKVVALVDDAAELSLEFTWVTAPEGHSLEAFTGLSHLGLGAKVEF